MSDPISAAFAGDTVTARLRGFAGLRDRIEATKTGAFAKGHDKGAADAAAEWIEIQARTDLTHKQKRALLHKRIQELRAKKRLAKREIAPLNSELADLNRKARMVEDWERTAVEIEAWVKKPLVLEKAETSALHALRNCITDRRLVSTMECYAHVRKFSTQALGSLTEVIDGSQAFVVQHNWAAAFTGAQDFDGDHFRLPSDVCAFEFRISGRRVVAFAFHTSEDEGSEIVMAAVIQDRDRWFEQGAIARYQGRAWHLNHDGDIEWFGTLVSLIGDQIKAICVALEAEVAVTDTIRQPHKLVAARVREGKTPPADYSIVVLSRRARSVPLPSTDAEPKRRVRLHFRRGHWRHFATHKTWIRWMLVGDPDLGFIDKHYRL